MWCHWLLAQDGETSDKKLFSITGNVGASANFYSSNETIKTRPSFAWNVNGNIMGTTGKWTLPLSFVINHYNNSNTSPYVQIGISPTYQWARFHLGYRYIPFSPLTFEGQSFRGAGVELYHKSFRFAAFYGRLNRAVNEDTSQSRVKVPQFTRSGYGVKVGIGNDRKFFDLIYFHAKDDSSSAALITPGSLNSLRAQENAVVGTSFKLTIAKKWIWTGDAAISGLIQDLSGKGNVDTSNQGLKNFMSNFLPDNPTLTAHYAGQSSLTFYATDFNSNLGYRRVQPGFKSLGTPYMVDDVELLSWINGFSIAKGKINVNTNLSQQHNNLSKTLAAEMRTQVGSFNVNTILGQRLNVNLNFSGYNLKQRNDRNKLPDSLRMNDTLLLNQQISQYGISPSYNLTRGNNIHFVNGNLTIQKLNDKNPKTAAQTNSKNLSTSLTYTLAFLNKPYTFSLNYLHSQYKQKANSYTSNGATFGTSAQLLKNKSLNLQGSVGYFSNRYNDGNTHKNMSYSANAGYQVKGHNFNLFANYIHTQPDNAIINAVNKSFPYAVVTKNLASGISYVYSF